MSTPPFAIPTSPVRVAEHFIATYGPDRVFFTVVSFEQRGHLVTRTFASDSLEHLVPWLLVQTAKLASGKVALLAMVVRVVSDDRTVEVLGPNGRRRIPEKDVYGFRFSPGRCDGLDADEVADAHMTDAATGEALVVEPGVRFCSGVEVLEAIGQP